MSHAVIRPSQAHLLLCILFPLLLVTPYTMGQNQRAVERSASDRVNEAFGLRASRVVTVDVTPGKPLIAALPLAGKSALLRLQPASVRGPNYQVFEQDENGNLVAVAPGEVRTLRGEVVGAPGLVVAGSLLEDGLHAAIYYPDGSSTWMEPVRGRLRGAPANEYVLYGPDDVISDGGLCGANDSMFAQGGPQAQTSEPPTSSAHGGCVAQIACDADYEYYLDYGASTANVEARINAVINAMNAQYERDVDITHQVTSIIVRTSAQQDPYTSTDAVTLLNQVRNQWNANHAGIQRDVVQMFTGTNLNGSTIGIAWIGSICTSYGYGVVQSDFNSSFACVTDLSAHELGHGWGAEHCRCFRPQSYTMNSSITCANQFHPSRTVPDILNFRDSRSCLTDCDGGSNPPPPPAPCTALEVASHACSSPGRRNQCVRIDITIECDNAAVSGVAVEVLLEGQENGDAWVGTSETNGSGEVSFVLRCKQAESSTYTSTVISLDGVDLPGSAPNRLITGCSTN